MGQTINELQNGGEPKKTPNLVSNPKVKYRTPFAEAER